MRRYTVRINGTEHTLDVEETARDQFVVHLGNRLVDVTLVDHEDLAQARIAPAVEIGNPRALPDAIPSATASRSAASVSAPGAPGTVRSSPPGQTPVAAGPRSGGAGRNALTAPMPGVVLSVEVAPGAVVARGQLLLVLEAMKMKNDIRAERDGVIAAVAVAAGDQVKHGDPMITFEG